jgi:hypothetical protein
MMPAPLNSSTPLEGPPAPAPMATGPSGEVADTSTPT